MSVGDATTGGRAEARLCNALAGLLEYPSSRTNRCLHEASEVFASLGAAGAVAALASYEADHAALSLAAQEELFVSTFELGASCVPYVSVHLFGEENFKRGAFLAALRGRMESLHFAWGEELPDHLGVLLRFLPSLPAEEAKDLGRYCLLGPLDKMRAALPEGNSYRWVLEAVEGALHSMLPGVEAAPAPMDVHAMAGCGTLGLGCGARGVPGA